MKNIFYSNKDTFLNHAANYLYVNKYRYERIVNALKQLGNFDNKIELFCEDEVNENVFVLDNDGYKFSFNVYAFDEKEKYQVKKQIDNFYTIFNFHKLNKFSKIQIRKINYGYELKNGYNLEVHTNQSHPKRYELKKNNVCYYFSLPSSVITCNKKLIKEFEKNNDMSFIDFYNIIKMNFDIKKADFIIIGLTKDEKEIGKISFKEGNIISFSLNETKGNESLNLHFINDNIDEKIIKTTEIPVEEADETLKLTLEKAKAIINENK